MNPHEVQIWCLVVVLMAQQVLGFWVLRAGLDMNDKWKALFDEYHAWVDEVLKDFSNVFRDNERLETEAQQSVPVQIVSFEFGHDEEDDALYELKPHRWGASVYVPVMYECRQTLIARFHGDSREQVEAKAMAWLKTQREEGA